MFKARQNENALWAGLSMLELIYHATVRYVRRSQGNAVLGLLRNIFQTVILILAFYVLMSLLGMRRSPIPGGDFVVFIMSGIFLFMTHTKTMTAVFGAENATSAMMKHAPMTTAVSISSAALGTLYLQMLSAIVVLYVYHAAFVPVSLNNWAGCLGMLLLAWFAGVALGVVFLSMKPWSPGIVAVVVMVYTRANMIASGKMFLANNLPPKMRHMFEWNPLFHAIDQARGFAFINYNPHVTSWTYALWLSLAVLMIGLMGEFYTRQYASASWNSRR